MTTNAAHRQTRYRPAPQLDEPDALPLPAVTDSLQQAKEDLSEFGMCLYANALAPAQIDMYGKKIDAQARAERELGVLSPPGADATKQLLSNLVNKGSEYLQLVEREETDVLAGYLLGSNFLISSVTAGVFHGPTAEPQPLHRDQGQVPATADFPAACNLFWMLDDFTPARGSTRVVPGSHRWHPDYLVQAPPEEMAVQVTAPAGTLFAWDGRLWHGTGINREGHPRRHIATFFCLPWMRQQENWGVTCLQDVLDEASPKLKVRLGLRTYGTLGMMSGTRTEHEGVSLGNYDVAVPEYVIGENGALHRMRRVSR